MGHGLIKRELLQAKIESVYGTDPGSFVGGDTVLVRNITHQPDRLRMVRRGAIRTSLGELQQIYGGMLQALSFECEVKGSGTAGTPPEIDVFLRACGLQVTNVPATSDTYAPRSSGLESCTIYYHEAAAGANTQVRHILLGCRGNVEFVWTTGDILLARFSMIGKRQGAPTDQTLPTPTYDATVPQAVKGMATTIGGVSGLVVQNYSLNLNNEIIIPDNLNDSEGYGQVMIAGRDPTMELNRHTELVATLAPWADLAAGTARAFASGTLGGSAGNRVALTAGQMHYRGITQGDDSGVRTNAFTFGLHETSTIDTEFSLAFT